MKWSFLVFFLIFSLRAQETFRWNKVNDPANLVMSYKTKFSDLPIEGKLNETPWSGSYWPTYVGGASYRWNQKGSPDDSKRYAYELENMTKIQLKSAALGLVGFTNLKSLSPTEKFDLYLADKKWPLTHYERNRTEVMKTVRGSKEFDPNFKIPKWFGLCHNWAPATLLYNNPNPVTISNKWGVKIHFGSADIKALLLLHLEINRELGYDPTKFYLGGRCNFSLKKLKEMLDKKEITKEEYKRKVDSEDCSDTNAGSFHIALTNLIGLRKMGFVMDIDRGEEVWNQGIYAYRSKIKSQGVYDSMVGLYQGHFKYRVETELLYVSEVNQDWERFFTPYGFKNKKYEYEIYTDRWGQIIGGKWLSYDRPDFIWMIRKPLFSEGLNDLSKIYHKSVGQDYKRPKKSRKELKKLFQKKAKLVKNARAFIKRAKSKKKREEDRESYASLLKKSLLKTLGY